MEIYLLRSNEKFSRDPTVARGSLCSSNDYPNLADNSSSCVIVKVMIHKLPYASAEMDIFPRLRHDHGMAV